MRFGLNIASITGDLPPDNEYASRTGFAAGLFAVLPLPVPWSLQSELLYSQKGFRNEAPSLDAAEVSVLELVYLEVPILLRYDVSLSRSTVFGLLIGPTVEFELSERQRLLSGGASVAQSSDVYRTTGAGLTIGGDVDVALGGFQAVLGGRYTHGLTNMLNEEASASPLAPSSAQNAVLSFFVGLRL
jgi:hypothetical protein